MKLFSPKIAIVLSNYYAEISQGLLEGATQVLKDHGIAFKPELDLFYAPGAFEIPLIAQKLAEHHVFSYEGVICLGCLIRGETAHFEWICSGISNGLMSASLKSQKPITFGVLTCLNLEQAQSRSQKNDHNKGSEAALACIQSIKTLMQIGAR